MTATLCIVFGCPTRPRPGYPTCGRHAEIRAPGPPCPDGHGELAFVVVSTVHLGGTLSLMYACPSCDYVTHVNHPPTPEPSQ